MPITDIGSYPNTMDEFANHWEDVNTELGGAPATDLKLQGAYTRTMFVTDRNAINTAIVGLVGLENDREIAASNRDALRTGLIGRLSQFRNMIRATLPRTGYAAAMPLVPQPAIAESKFLTPFDDMANLWIKINLDTTTPGFTPPLVIGPYTVAQLQTELTTMRAAFATVTLAENDERIARENRDTLLPLARERMVQYRAAVEALFGPTHALTESLPDVYPQAGSTPDPVTLSGSWNAGVGEAQFSFTESSNPDVQEYEFRMSPGATYDAGTATVIGNIPVGAGPAAMTAAATITFSTTAGLDNPGDTASFKVFVRLSTGNEAGSNTITITRP